ncbi:MAG: alpha/beta hydrolase [Desulfovibrio sp.]|jgi:pimeloyl-ACP methyl ester carboxylesterase|nr:alpha/beta hydrolase [Desulfovibrio sp.]
MRFLNVPEKRFTTPSGQVLTYTDLPGHSPCVIFLHGFADSRHSFDRVLECLKSGNRCLVPDLRGHGNSGKPDSGYALEDFCRDIEYFQDSLTGSASVLVGHSLGSFIAQSMAAEMPESVEGLILIGTAACCADNEVVRDLRDEICALPDGISETFIREFQKPSLPVPRDFLEKMIAESKKLPFHVWRECSAELAHADNRPLLGRIRAKTLVLHGIKDSVFSVADQDELLAALPHSSLVRCADCGHALHWEKPEFTARRIAEFLN